jgi:DMSO/TMAO reductase YedYZ molybdopterin-dependent catalytic subunit
MAVESPPPAPATRAPRQPLPVAVNSGLAGASIAILAGWLATLAGASSPFEPVAEAIMARTPPEFANHLLGWFGALARPAALLGAVAVYLALVALGALPLSLPARGGLRRLASAAAAVVAAWCAAHWLGLPAGGWFVVGSGLLIAWYLDARLVPRTPPHSTGAGSNAQAGDTRGMQTRMPALGRRPFLGGSLATGVLVLTAANAVFLSALARAVTASRAAGARLFAWSPPAARVAGFDLAGLEPEVTPVSRFYRMSKNVDDPTAGALAWRLAVDGLVQQRLSLRYDQLLALPRTDAYATLRCISNDVGGHLMSTALFSGVRLGALLSLAAPGPPADTLVMQGIDGQMESVPLAVAGASEAMVAYAMNGQAIAGAHGFPARVLLPGLYGFKQVKWLTRLELARGPRPGHWEQLGWTADARVNTVARTDLVRQTPDGAEAAGIAYAGDRGIRAVEVRVDGGPWLPATLNAPPLSALTWVQWRAVLPARSGLLESRAIDGNGVAQDETSRSLYPDGAAGLDRLRFDVS